MRVVTAAAAANPWGNNAVLGGDEEEDLSKHEPTSAERARTVLGSNRSATLSVAIGEAPAAPLSFAVPYALDDKGIPIAAMRAGVEKALRLRNDIQVCLSVAETPLTAASSGSPGGISVLAVASPIPPGSSEIESALSQFVRTQPAEASAVKRGTSTLYRLMPNVILVTSGAGEIARVDIEEYREAAADPLAAVAPGLVSHLGSDENGSLVLLCRAYGGAHSTKAAELVGIDQYGMDLLATTAKGQETIRIAFSHLVSSPDDVRRELVAMARGARFKLGAG
jgi:putative heme iron utilization protein